MTPTAPAGDTSTAQLGQPTGPAGWLGPGARSLRIGEESVPLPKVKLPEFDLTKLLAGDWLGALRVAVPAWATAVALSVILMVVVHPNGASVKQFLIAVAVLVSSAFGGDVVLTAGASDTDFNFSTAIGAYPLTITLAALAVGAWLFARQIRKHRTWVPVLFDALRSSVVFAFLIGLVVIVLRGKLKASGSPLTAQVLSDVSGDVGGRVVSAVLIAFLLFFVTTAASLLRRRLELPARAARVRDTVAAPLSGLVAMIAASWAVGVGVAVGGFLADKDLHNSTGIAALAAVLPNLGLGGALVGGGAGLRYEIVSTVKGSNSDKTVHLTWLADHVTNWVWLLPAALLIVFAAGALATVVRSTSRRAAAQNLVTWIVACAMLLPLLGHFVGAHVHYKESGAGAEHTTAFFGLSAGSVLLVAALAAFVLALVGSALLRERHPAGTTAGEYGGAPAHPGQQSGQPPYQQLAGNQPQPVYQDPQSGQ